jgi:hypothetical protein
LTPLNRRISFSRDAFREARLRLEVEGRAPVDDVSEAAITTALRGLRSYGPASYASLTRSDGDYVQVAGGGVSCMMERREAATGRQFRAYKDRKHPVFVDGTILSFRGGEIPLMSDEWFNIADVKEAFLAFLSGAEFPPSVRWRDISTLLSPSTTD